MPRRACRFQSGLIGISLLAACGAATSPSELAARYTLATVNGNPLPASISPLFSGLGRRRIVGATVDLVSTDSLRYAMEFDFVTPLPDGSDRSFSSGCFAARFPYSRSGSQIVIKAGSFRGLPFSIPYTPSETLRVEGRALRQSLPALNAIHAFRFESGERVREICDFQ